MKRPAFQSLRLARKRLAEERLPLSNVRKPFKWHDRLTLIVSACASVAAMVGVGVGYLQVQQMNLARNDAIKVAKKAELAAQEAGKLDIKRTDAETDQALALAEQVKAITTQVEVSRNQASSSEAQAQSMQSLAFASSSQARSLASQSDRMGRMAKATENQYDLQNRVQFSSTTARFSLGFENAELNSLQTSPYDPSLPYDFRIWFRNDGLNSAFAIARVTPHLKKSGERVSTEFCINLKCPPNTPITVHRGASMTMPYRYPPISMDLKDLEKGDYNLYIVLTVDFQDVEYRSFGNIPLCKFYSFRARQWSECGSFIN